MSLSRTQRASAADCDTQPDACAHAPAKPLLLSVDPADTADA